MLASARAELGYKTRPLGDGDRLEVGEVVFDVMQTPGHTPERINLNPDDFQKREASVTLRMGERSARVLAASSLDQQAQGANVKHKPRA